MLRLCDSGLRVVCHATIRSERITRCHSGRGRAVFARLECGEGRGFSLQGHFQRRKLRGADGSNSCSDRNRKRRRRKRRKRKKRKKRRKRKKKQQSLEEN